LLKKLVSLQGFKLPISTIFYFWTKHIQITCFYVLKRVDKKDSKNNPSHILEGSL